MQTLKKAFLTFGVILSSSFVFADVPKYQDKFNGLYWFNSKGSEFHWLLSNNGCDKPPCLANRNSDGTRTVRTEDSPAAMTCQRIGARLPTKFEFESLIRNFDHIEYNKFSKGPELTLQGRNSMAEIFQSSLLVDIWTSTIVEDYYWKYPGDASYAFYFNVLFNIVLKESRNVRKEVWCVKETLQSRADFNRNTYGRDSFR